MVHLARDAIDKNLPPVLCNDKQEPERTYEKAGSYVQVREASLATQLWHKSRIIANSQRQTSSPKPRDDGDWETGEKDRRRNGRCPGYPEASEGEERQKYNDQDIRGHPPSLPAHRTAIYLTKALILVVTPLPALTINTYASFCGFSHELPLPAQRLLQNTTNIISQTLPLPSPSPETFVLASITLTLLISTHRRLNGYEPSQGYIMIASICLGFLIGGAAKMSVLAIVLYILPWAAWLGSIVSEVHEDSDQSRK